MLILSKISRFINVSAQYENLIRLNDTDYQKLFKETSEKNPRDLMKNNTIQQLLKISASKGLVSLSANQIGSFSRAFVALSNPEEGKWTGYQAKETDYNVYINPSIIKISRIAEERWEACPSLPYLYAFCKRAKEIEIKYTDAEGKTHTNIKSGFEARVLQHELDHLSGCLMIVSLISGGKLRSSHMLLEYEIKEFQLELEKRKKTLTKLYFESSDFRKYLALMNQDVLESINTLIMTCIINAYFIARLNGILNLADLSKIEFKDHVFAKLIRDFS